jgi:hypothetical protein
VHTIKQIHIDVFVICSVCVTSACRTSKYLPHSFATVWTREVGCRGPYTGCSISAAGVGTISADGVRTERRLRDPPPVDTGLAGWDGART